MIHYQLACDRGDRFDGWFGNSADFDSQLAAADIACPACGSTVVRKALMAPSVRTGTGRAAVPEDRTTRADGDEQATVSLTTAPDPSIAQAVEMIRRVTRHVRDNAEDVGRRFAEEARKIHYKEAPARSLVGEATAAEAKELVEEGIAFHPLPVLPEDRN